MQQYINIRLVSYIKKNYYEDALWNYCPISNLPFLSKFVEKVIARQLNIHLYILRDPFQFNIPSWPLDGDGTTASEE